MGFLKVRVQPGGAIDDVLTAVSLSDVSCESSALLCVNTECGKPKPFLDMDAVKPYGSSGRKHQK